jgi:chemotaxis protein MotD
MIDASATAIGRGSIAVNGLKNSGSQEDASAQDEGYGFDFGDYLDGASSDAAAGDISEDAAGNSSAYASSEAGDATLTRSIFSLIAIAQAGAKTGQQAGADAAALQLNNSESQLAQGDIAALSTEAGDAAVSLAGQAEPLEGSRLAALLAGADGPKTAELLAEIVAQIQQTGQPEAPMSIDEDAQALPADASEDGSVVSALFAEVDPIESDGAAHHLLSALSKALQQEDGVDDDVVEAEEDAASPASQLELDPIAAASGVVKAIEVSETASARGTDSAKDALAQITSPAASDDAVHSDLSVEESIASAATGDELSIDGFDQLTVLDSRRYLGFGGDNAKMLTAALAGEANRALAPYTTVADMSAQPTATTVNTLKIQMNPEHLGTMTASLRLKGDELSVEVTVDTIEGYRHLAKDQQAIVQSLRDQGFAVDQVSIQLNPAPKTESQQQDQGQNGSNQNLREGQGDAQRQQSGDGRSVPQSDRISSGDLSSSELGDGRSAGDSGDGLYL